MVSGQSRGNNAKQGEIGEGKLMTALKTAQVILNDADIRKAIAQYIGRELNLDGCPCSPESIRVMFRPDGAEAWGTDCQFRVEMTVHI